MAIRFIIDSIDSLTFGELDIGDWFMFVDFHHLFVYQKFANIELRTPLPEICNAIRLGAKYGDGHRQFETCSPNAHVVKVVPAELPIRLVTCPQEK